MAIENVTGLLTSNGGRDFQAVCALLAEQGYGFGALEADAADFLPQSRRRVLIIGTREPARLGPAGAETPAIARARAALPAELRERWIAWPATAPRGANRPLAALLEPDDRVPWRTPAQTARLIALMAPLHRARLEAVIARGERRVGAVFRRIRAGVQRAEVRFDGLAGCLRTPRGGSSRQMLIVAEAGGCRSRFVTGREAARLMGLPDSYLLPASTNAALHIAGDGVAVPVVAWLERQVLRPLLEADGAVPKQARRA